MQQNAFDFDPPRARRTDPSTSHAAAAAAATMAGQHCAAILEALNKFGPMGKDQIASRCRLDGVQVCRRLTELQAANLARPTGRKVKSDSGRDEREWMAWPQSVGDTGAIAGISRKADAQIQSSKAQFNRRENR